MTSTAFGYHSSTSGIRSTAIGDYNESQGSQSYTFGSGEQNLGSQQSLAIGRLLKLLHQEINCV
ncbi:MAG: hypothetical protein IPN08_12295 [Bacteroidales bacterium]|nr:hypothetical protein [Bacteroidales bacterium]